MKNITDNIVLIWDAETESSRSSLTKADSLRHPLTKPFYVILFRTKKVFLSYILPNPILNPIENSARFENPHLLHTV